MHRELWSTRLKERVNKHKLKKNIKIYGRQIGYTRIKLVEKFSTRSSGVP